MYEEMGKEKEKPKGIAPKRSLGTPTALISCIFYPYSEMIFFIMLTYAPLNQLIFLEELFEGRFCLCMRRFCCATSSTLNICSEYTIYYPLVF